MTMAPRYWGLEVLKMGCYVAFPVAMFHYYNTAPDTDLKEYRDKLMWSGAKEKEQESKRTMDKIRQEKMEQMLHKN